MVSTTNQRELVAACCQAAVAAGVRTGMTLAHARALLPIANGQEPRVEPFDLARDTEALIALARWCLRLAPVVAPDPPDGLLMDLSGCERMYRGIHPMVQSVGRAMKRLGFRAVIALAPTFGCAWGMARFHGGGHPLIHVPAGCQRRAMNPLPVAALRLPPAVCAGLAEVAVDRVRDLLNLPRPDIAGRFGPEVTFRIDQALGEAMEVIRSVRTVEPVRAERIFDGPTTHAESLGMAAREILGELVDRLKRAGKAARLVEFTLIRSDLPPVMIAAITSRPTQNAKHLWRLLGPKLERANLGFGVQGMHAVAMRLCRARDAQHSWSASGPDGGLAPAGAHEDGGGAAAGDTIDALVSRLGEARVVRPEVCPSHVPQRAGRTQGVMDERAGQPRSTSALVTASPRPTLLFDPPEPAEVIALWPDGPPSWLRWRGREVRLFRAAGPERLSGEWWRIGRALARHGPVVRERDYFRVLDEHGACLWLYRDGLTGRWFVHGVW